MPVISRIYIHTPMLVFTFTCVFHLFDYCCYCCHNCYCY